MPAPRDKAPSRAKPASKPAGLVSDQAPSPPTPKDQAQALVDQLSTFNDELNRAWSRAANAGDNARADDLKQQLDHLQPQLVDALQRLLDAVDSGKDITDLQDQMAVVLKKAKTAQDKVKADTATATEIAGVIDLFGKVIKLATTLAG